MKLKISLLLAMPITLALTACDPRPQSTDKRQSIAQEKNSKAALDAVGMPNIVNFTEARDLNLLYELRDQVDLITYTYIMDMQGKLHHVCDSISMGINSSIQMSNPVKVVRDSYGNVTVGQKEPNNLFMPEGLEATYAKCVISGKLKVFYVEEKLIVSPVKLRAVDSFLPGYDVTK